MSDKNLSAEVRQFLRRYIQSVEQLEILLLLRSQRTVLWTPRSVFDVIRSSESSAADRLAGFSACGFLLRVEIEPAAYKYQPKDPQLARLVEAIAQEYQVRRVLVIEAIYMREADSTQSFADAFKFKKT